MEDGWWHPSIQMETDVCPQCSVACRSIFQSRTDQDSDLDWFQWQVSWLCEPAENLSSWLQALSSLTSLYSLCTRIVLAEFVEDTETVLTKGLCLTGTDLGPTLVGSHWPPSQPHSASLCHLERRGHSSCSNTGQHSWHVSTVVGRTEITFLSLVNLGTISM